MSSALRRPAPARPRLSRCRSCIGWRRTRAAERKSCRVLVLSPTRELSGQILDSFRAYGRHLRMSTARWPSAACRWARQVRSLLNGVDVLVATPGRLLDLVKRSNALRLGCVECLVLDEADRMLDMGFIHDIRTIVAKLPAPAANLVLLGHHAARYRRSGRADAARSGQSRRDAGGHHGRTNRAAHHPYRSWRKARTSSPTS